MEPIHGVVSCSTRLVAKTAPVSSRRRSGHCVDCVFELSMSAATASISFAANMVP